MEAPLHGIKVLEFAGLAPVPMAGKILRDFGASVLRIDRVALTPVQKLAKDPLSHGKRSIAIDIKTKDGREIVKKLCNDMDVLLDSYRPGVLERFGLGPDKLLKTNEKLIYARLSGYGQHGPMSQYAGHDINYLSISGVLSQLGRFGEKPTAPINLLGDFAGGSFTCVMGIMAALFERTTSGKGQVIDVSMVEGASYLSSFLHTSKNDKMFIWTGERGTNALDTGAPFYDTYKTKDGKYMAVGSIEPQFYKVLINGLGLDGIDLPHPIDVDSWNATKDIFTKIFLTKTQIEWTEIFATENSCVTPVLELEEAANHPHNKSRGSFIKRDNGAIWEPQPAPQFSRSKLNCEGVLPERGQHTINVLYELGYADTEIDKLITGGVVEQCEQPKSSL